MRKAFCSLARTGRGRQHRTLDAEYRAMVLLAAYGSLRFGELAGLRRHRVEVLHKTIQVEESAVELADGRVTFSPPKSAAGRRTVAVPADLMALIEDHLSDHVAADPDALLFTSPAGHSCGRSSSSRSRTAQRFAQSANSRHFESRYST